MPTSVPAPAVSGGSAVHSASEAVVARLAARLDAEPDFGRALTASLETAATRARGAIRDALYAALPWPQTPEAYLDYLRDFARYVPQQTPETAWESPDDDGYQEPHDRMVHFYWLVDQPLDDAGAVLQADDGFATWLRDYARAWGAFLDTPASLTPETLASFYEHSPAYDAPESEADSGAIALGSGYQTFNQFFSRALAPGARPIHAPADNATLTAVADAGFESTHRIDATGAFPAVTVKHSHVYADVATLLGADDELAARFRGGTYVHYHLKPYAYHRFHTCVAGRVTAVRHLEGRTYLKTGIEDGKLEGYNDASNGYEFAQQRAVLLLDTAEAFGGEGDLGLVALVPVGMGHVSSVRVTAEPDGYLRKGDEFGMFLYGGSGVVVLFEARAGVALEEFSGDKAVGEVVGRAQLAR